jgi:methanogenic corrinoid protein MtbC1
MSAPAVVYEAVETFLDLAIHSDAPSAIRLTLDLLDQGAKAEAVIVDLLAAAQRESGRRWLRNEWTVADEHVVSGVTQRALDAVANTVEPPRHDGAVVVACAEGDWHALASQMFAEMIRCHGYHVTFLGASTPAEHVARLLTRDRPDALIVTCSLSLYFAGVTRLANAAHRAGVPVIAGGRALNGPRALRLGADAWEPDVAATLAKLRSWRDRPPALLDPISSDVLAVQLDIDSPVLAAGAFDTMMDSYPHMREFNPDQLDRTREDLVFILRYVAAARLVDDRAVFQEFLGWLTELLETRGVPATALVAGLDALAPVVDSVDVDAGQLVRHGLRELQAALGC